MPLRQAQCNAFRRSYFFCWLPPKADFRTGQHTISNPPKADLPTKSTHKAPAKKVTNEKSLALQQSLPCPTTNPSCPPRRIYNKSLAPSLKSNAGNGFQSGSPHPKLRAGRFLRPSHQDVALTRNVCVSAFFSFQHNAQIFWSHPHNDGPIGLVRSALPVASSPTGLPVILKSEQRIEESPRFAFLRNAVVSEGGQSSPILQIPPESE